ncbi:MAG: transposase [Streptococcaceae bacterium]|jgi:putative transposase|nr:transposase [Streptococcaceae bacterium]
MAFVQSQHIVYRLSYHIVWVCKYRRRVLNSVVVEYMKKIMPKLLKSIPGVEVEKIGFDQDYVHFDST